MKYVYVVVAVVVSILANNIGWRLFPGNYAGNWGTTFSVVVIGAFILCKMVKIESLIEDLKTKSKDNLKQ